MLSLLLTAAIACPDVPAALCPPCHPEDAPLTFGGFLLSVLKSLVSLAVIVFPLYKTFKAWESNRLKACRAMLAYWSAITLLNAMKDITDEIVGNWMNPYLHHIIVAVIKLAPLVLGPDAIYHHTVRPFFEHHEGEMDSVIMKANVKAREVQHDLQPLIHQVEQAVTSVEHAVAPTLEQVKDKLMDTTHRVEHALGLDKDREAELQANSPSPLSAEEAVKRDEELTVQHDPTSLTGLRQRSKQPSSSTAASAATGGLAPSDEAEIQKAKANDVLVEKLVWGRALHAKNEEYQRQVKEKEAFSQSVTPALHEVQAEMSRPSHTVPPSAVTPSTVVHTTQSSAHPAPPPVVESHPPLSAFPAPPPVVPPTTTATTTTTATSTATSTTTLSATTSNASVVNVQDVSRLKGMSTAGVVTAATDGPVMSNKKVLLDSKGGPQIVHTSNFGTLPSEQQKEL